MHRARAHHAPAPLQPSGPPLTAPPRPARRPHSPPCGVHRHAPTSPRTPFAADTLARRVCWSHVPPRGAAPGPPFLTHHQPQTHRQVKEKVDVTQRVHTREEHVPAMPPPRRPPRVPEALSARTTHVRCTHRHTQHGHSTGGYCTGKGPYLHGRHRVPRDAGPDAQTARAQQVGGREQIHHLHAQHVPAPAPPPPPSRPPWQTMSTTHVAPGTRSCSRVGR